MKNMRRRALFFGFAMSMIGLTTGIYIRITAIGDYDDFPYYSTLSSFLTSYILWLYIIEKPMKYNLKRGVLVGATSIVLAHYLTFYLSILVANMQYWIFNMKVTSLNEAPIDPVSGLIACLLYTFISYLFVGWFTIPLGAIVGWIYSKKANTHLVKQSESD